ncbi:MAG: tRNA (adenosine(37)-N6)-dimethylallyltransferase MiaA [Bacteroidales bacterium]|nr:tRNA (adenosine(37)-N6)-dimethylallyltransferase MiaA [Bacteroidales bacterium]
MHRYDLIAVIGPTASGKTEFAARLAQNLDGEVISADSRQVYRNMNIGTGKDYSDYLVNGTAVPVHLIDIAEPGYKYSIFEYQRDFFQAYRDVASRNKMPVLCGGSGMYIEAVTHCYRLDEVPVNEKLRLELQGKSLNDLKEILLQLKTLHNQTDTDTVEHALRAIEIEYFYHDHPGERDLPNLSILYLGILYDRDTERKRITERLHKRLQQGMVEEVRSLLASGISADSLSYYGLEYRYITRYLTGKMEYETMVSLLNTAIHQFAKRQRTWFRRMERRGTQIHWISGELPLDEKIESALALLNS